MFLGTTFEGKEHDKTILEYDEISFKEKIDGYIDLAYLNLKIKNMIAIIPQKKPKGKELTKEQKEQNKNKSKIRVGVEHAICSVKRLFILKYQLRVKNYKQHDTIMLLGVALHNFRIKYRKNQPVN